MIDHFVSIDAIAEAEVEQIEIIQGIGSKTAESVANFFSQAENKVLLEKLKSAGLQIQAKEPFDLSQIAKEFLGKTFVLTGTLTTLTRSAASERIKLMGGKVSSNISKKTDFVVVGENAGSKKNQALALGTQILTEDDFLEMINSV